MCACEYLFMGACDVVKHAVDIARKIRFVAEIKGPFAPEDQSLPFTHPEFILRLHYFSPTLFRSIAPSPLGVENSPGTRQHFI